MEWIEGTPEYGDMIRVKVKFYHHYGIFADDSTVIQFGLPDNTGVPAKEIKILVTDIDTFLNGGMLETPKYTASEKMHRRSPEDTVKYALSKVGTGDYHILHNNCEHFANECLFGVPKSSFVDGVRESIRNKMHPEKENND